MKKIGWLLITLVILMFCTSCGNEQKQLKIIEQTESTTVCELIFDFKYESFTSWGAGNFPAVFVFNNKNEKLFISKIQYFSFFVSSGSPSRYAPTIFYPGDKIRIFTNNYTDSGEFSVPHKIDIWYYYTENPTQSANNKLAKTIYF